VINCQIIRDFYKSKKITKQDSCHKTYSPSLSKSLRQFMEHHANNSPTLDHILSQTSYFPILVCCFCKTCLLKRLGLLNLSFSNYNIIYFWFTILEDTCLPGVYELIVIVAYSLHAIFIKAKNVRIQLLKFICKHYVNYSSWALFYANI